MNKLNSDLTPEKCQNILYKYLTNKPNYYQINAFIKILSREFNKFYN